MTAERVLLCVWAAELEFAKAWSCLAEIKGKKGNLHVLALIIATFFANFLTNFNENSEWTNHPYSDDLLLPWAFGSGIWVKEGSCCLYGLCLNLRSCESSKLVLNLWLLKMVFTYAHIHRKLHMPALSQRKTWKSPFHSKDRDRFAFHSSARNS